MSLESVPSAARRPFRIIHCARDGRLPGRAPVVPRKSPGAIIGACPRLSTGARRRSPLRRRRSCGSAAASTSAAGSWARAATSASSSTATRCAWPSRRAARSRASCARTRSSRWTSAPRRSAAGEARVSAEALLHVEVVRARGAGAVLHTHSIWTTILSERHAAAGALCHRGLRDAQGTRRGSHPRAS